MGFQVLFPAGFEPENYGWEVVSPYAADQRLAHEAYELAKFGFVSTNWLRWEIPFQDPASLVRAGYDKASGRYFGLYQPAVGDREAVKASELSEELLRGQYGRPFGAPPQTDDAGCPVPRSDDV